VVKGNLIFFAISIPVVSLISLIPGIPLDSISPSSKENNKKSVIYFLGSIKEEVLTLTLFRFKNSYFGQL